MKASKEMPWWLLLPFQIAAVLAYGTIFLAYLLGVLSPLFGVLLLIAWVGG